MKKSWFGPLLVKRTVIFSLLFLQLAFLVGLVVSSSKFFVFFYWVLAAVRFYAALGILTRRMKGGFKVTWMFLILLFPLFGGLFYLFFTYQASTISFRKRLRRIHATTRGNFRLLPSFETRKESFPIMRYLDSVCGFPAFSGGDSTYFPLGEDFFRSLLTELKTAKEYIFLEFFIIEEGKMWNEILKILEEKAKEGVKVRLIYDDFGCFFLLPKDFKETLEKKGISCAVFNPFRPFLTAWQNHRDHRKIVVIDGTTAFTGGMNLADEYINEIEKHGHWKDSGIRIFGPAAWSFGVMFLQQWAVCTKKSEDFERFCPKKTKLLSPVKQGLMQPFSDSPMDFEDVYETVYLSLINQAKKYVYFTTPYLILDDSFILALKNAAKSGVDVKIITPHIGDKRFVHATTRSYYKELLLAGVKIYEYKKGFIHAKSCVSDDTFAVVGTANLDFRSLYFQFECGVLITSKDTVTSLYADFCKTKDESIEITPEDCALPKWKTIIEKILRIFAPLM